MRVQKPGMRDVPWRRVAGSRAVWAVIVSHFTYNYGLYTLMTTLPTYFKRVQGFDIKKVGRRAGSEGEAAQRRACAERRAVGLALPGAVRGARGLGQAGRPAAHALRLQHDDSAQGFRLLGWVRRWVRWRW